MSIQPSARVQAIADAALGRKTHVQSPAFADPVGVVPFSFGSDEIGAIQVVEGGRAARVMSDELTEDEAGRVHEVFDELPRLGYVALTLEQIRGDHRTGPVAAA